MQTHSLTANTQAILAAIADAQASLAKAQKAVLRGKSEKAQEALTAASGLLPQVFNALVGA